ncbi:unnamed protein product [Plutella xylostella]|uniref:(diamondback moth) hypothetical protein n=1 Tax=Plutella xylostella TaxID=51655 RepID=A0A8S4FNY6_PLUXY|nr:unnamed protein product [Plutella xylostella]
MQWQPRLLPPSKGGEHFLRAPFLAPSSAERGKHYLNAAFKGDQLIVSTVPLTMGRTLSMETTLVNDRSGAVVAKGTTMFLQGGDKFQTGAKDILGFDVYEN